MGRRFILFICFTFLLLLSCSRRFYYLDGVQISSDHKVSSDSIFVQTAYAGDALDFIIFEVSIKNKTPDTIFIDRTDVKLIISGNELYEKSVIFHALDKHDILYDLHQQKERTNKAKKTNTTLNIIGVGLNLIGIAASRNVSAAETIIYTAESAAYILEDRRAYNLLEGSLEEQQDYIDQWVLGKDVVAPGETRSWDLLFERLLVDTEGSLEIFCADHAFYFDYNFRVREERY